MRAYVGVGCSLPVARRLELLAHHKYLKKSQWFLYEDAISTLKTLSALGQEHAILSNHVPELSEILDTVGLTPNIRTIFSSALTGYEKPHPQAFLQALDMPGRPQTVWMIDDNIEADVLGDSDSWHPCHSRTQRGYESHLCFSCSCFALGVPFTTVSEQAVFPQSEDEPLLV